MAKEPIVLLCRDACGNKIVEGVGPENTVEQLAMRQGWSLLAIAQGWRCPKCARMLDIASKFPGTAPRTMFVDTVPAISRGALPRATFDSIAAPVVPSNPQE